MDRDFPGGSVAKDSELLMWGAWVQSLFRELKSCIMFYLERELLFLKMGDKFE